MKRLVLVLVLAGAGACSKPSDDECRKAVLNLQRIRGLDTNAHAPDPEQYVRKCRATGNTSVVRCIINAKTEAEVARCEPQSPAAQQPQAPQTPTTPPTQPTQPPGPAK